MARRTAACFTLVLSLLTFAAAPLALQSGTAATQPAAPAPRKKAPAAPPAKPQPARPGTAKPATAKPATGKPATAKKAPARPAPLPSKPLTPPAPAAEAVTLAPAIPVERQLAFLEDAKIVASKPIGKGTTGALRVTLSDGTLTHDAAFNSVAEEPRMDGKKRLGELRFVDHFRYNIAAWRIAVLLGLGPMMPATVERGVNGKDGALSWWVDDVLMDEGEREAKDVQPSNTRRFANDRMRMTLFAELIRDIDRNKGNVVYTKDWRVIMIDFTRSFRLETAIRPVGLLARCDRNLLARMRTLTRDGVEEAVDDYLTGDEIKAVIARRDLLVAHFDKLIAERGENVVLY